MKKILFLIIFIMSSLFSQVDYASQIQPILNANCTTCHYSSGGMGSLNLTSFSELMSGGVSGPSIVAGDHQNSLLYQRIVLPPGTDGNMPPNVPLSQSQIDIIAQWIDQGASLQISDNISISPEKHILYQNYPNPFNPNTTLSYTLSQAGFVNITIYDMAGNTIKTITNGSQNAGLKKVDWNATNDNNEPVSAGLYIYKMQANEFTKTMKMLLLK
jgi:hypothetical protein